MTFRRCSSIRITCHHCLRSFSQHLNPGPLFLDVSQRDDAFELLTATMPYQSCRLPIPLGKTRTQTGLQNVPPSQQSVKNSQ